MEAERENVPQIWLGGAIGHVIVVEWLNGITDPASRHKLQEAIVHGADRAAGDGLHFHAKTIHIGEANMSKEEKNEGSKSVNVTARDMTNVNIGIDQQIQDSFKMVQQAPAGEVKDTLATLHKQVEEMLKNPALKKPDEVADDLKSLTEEATKPEPRQKRLETFSDGLIEAAKTVGEMATPVITTVKVLLDLLT